MPETVVFLHGAWVTNACWDAFAGRFRAAGFECHAPPWPHADRPVAELRARPDPAFGRLGIAAIVRACAAFVERFPEPPILVGHSFGGLFAQLLLDRGLGAAGVAIDAAPPRGILPGPNAVRAGLPVLLTWRAWERAVTMSLANFRWSYAQHLSAEEARETYERHVIPAPGRIYFEALLGIGTRVDHANAGRGPLLLVAGGDDRTVEPAMVRANYRRHRRSGALVDLRELPGRSHWLIAERGWEAVADTAIEWLRSPAVAQGIAAARTRSGGRAR